MSKYFIFIVLLFSISFSGCAKYINVNYIVPAKELDVMKYKTVAVTEFEGDKNNQYSSMLESTLKGLTFYNKKLYNVMDRKNIESILKEQSFQVGIADENTIVKMGKLAGVDAIWTGSVTEMSDETPYYETRYKCVSYDQGVCRSSLPYIVRCRNVTVNLTFIPKLISVSTGTIIYSKTFNQTDRNSACDGSWLASSQAELINEAREDIFYKLKNDISPRIATIELELKTDDDEIINKTDKKIFKDSLAFVDARRMDRACELWRELIKANRGSIALNYNIGICFEYEGKYTEALDQMRFVDKLLTKPDDLISLGIRRGEANIRRMHEVNKQLSTDDLM